MTVALLAAALLAAVAAASAHADEAEQIYQPLTVSRINLGLSPEAIEALENEPDEYVKGTFSLALTDGTPGGSETKLTPSPINAEIRLKGSTSFEGIHEKAAFKIKFKKSERFLGLRKMTLNNMVEDPSMIHETLAYAAFRAAGVPAPRTGFAEVSVNGELIGVELDLETLDVDFLEKHFGPFDEATQHLYEGEDGTDVTPGSASKFEIDEGEETSRADLEALIAAVNAEGSPFSTRVAPYADLEEMTAMWAVEKYVGQWDGYSGQVGAEQPNNYYLYSSPAGVFQMFPWGLDETWQLNNRIPFDGKAGVLFDKCLEDETCAAEYRAALRSATGGIGAAGLGTLAEEAANLLAPWQQAEADEGRPKYSIGDIAEAVEGTEDFVARRGGEAEAWLAEHEPAPPAPPPTSSGPAAPIAATAPTCLVPRLAHRQLTAARKSLRAAHCRLSKVTRAKGVSAKRGRVTRQSPKPGRALPAGAAVTVRLG